MAARACATAAAGAVGALRRDPMAMLPFCGYNMADYWAHWLAIGERESAVLPRIYMVNWFRKSAGGDFLWPGFGENGRVLQWIFQRCEGDAKAIETPIGNLPTPDGLDTDDLDVDAEDMAELLRVDVAGWLEELPGIRDYYAEFGDHVPTALHEELAALEKRLRASET